ncbi:thioredoxin domain-containing protein [Lacinutrix sp.]|uniref:thioredoxin domain-containing protein n=2 Tax=Lacinutrix sp. TaxID=1937692 RepID=UPI00262C2C4B|nr:thioredoxin domain-containing protein [Lacinutrix sp.]MDG1714910.1 thioredoxin domain-containing protein [Lacinutrix sp.]
MYKKIIVFSILIGLSISCEEKTKQLAHSAIENSANGLIHETSPYLLQHAYNPVNWKPWNAKTLALAKKDNKLMVISVGYSACHWCHVMEEESFENDSVAKLMNANFINIKVDREERPDVDQVYMNAVQLMTGSGGWPLNCITLPDGRPVFGGTYFEKEQWEKILKDISQLYKTNPEKVIAFAEKLTEGVKTSDLITLNQQNIPFKTESLQQYVQSWKKNLDYTLGGNLNAPKFPLPNNLNFLMRYSYQNDDIELKDYVSTTLTKMANGGLYDQVGGGFSRYAVDQKWHIPHFEKMLYDNAQLVSVYSQAYLITKNENYKKVVLETLNFVERELLQTEGAFYSSIDADSLNDENQLEEGVFYSWNEEELKSILKEEFSMFSSYYNINLTGKWENNQYILFKTITDEAFAKSNNISVLELDAKVSKWKQSLNKVRNKRPRPRTDDKVLTSWNALMLKGYVDAYRVFRDINYLNKAVKNAEFIKNKLLTKEGSLFHNYKNGKATINGFSEDYAHVISAYIDLYQITLDEKWLNLAKDLMDYSINHFLDKNNSMFYFTADSETDLITRKVEVYDNVISSSNSILADNLFKLGHYYSNKNYLELAKQMLNNMIVNIDKAPSSYSNWLSLYLNYSNPYYELAISGANAKEKLKEVNIYYLPNILIAGATQESKLPIMENRFIEADTYIYVCVDGSCKLPVTNTKEAIDQLLK